MLSLPKYIIKYGFLGKFSILDENNTILVQVKQNLFGTKYTFYQADNTTVPWFQIRKISSKFGIFKGSVTYGIFADYDAPAGSIQCEAGLGEMSSAIVYDQYNQEIGKFVLQGNLYDYIAKDKIVGKLFKNTFLGYTYMFDLSKADPSADKKAALAFAVLAIKSDIGKRYRNLTYTKNIRLDWEGAGVGSMICPNCKRSYDKTWKVCLQCRTPLETKPEKS